MFLARVDHLRQSATTTHAYTYVHNGRTRFLKVIAIVAIVGLIILSSPPPRSRPRLFPTIGDRWPADDTPLLRCHVSDGFAHQNAPVHAVVALLPHASRVPPDDDIAAAAADRSANRVSKTASALVRTRATAGDASRQCHAARQATGFSSRRIGCNARIRYRVHGFGRLLCVVAVAVATMEETVALVYDENPELPQQPSADDSEEHHQQLPPAPADEDDGENGKNAFYCNAAYR